MAIVDITELPAAAPAATPFVGLDLGEKTIGVAFSDTRRIIASPARLIRRTRFSKDAENLFALMAAHGAMAMVIGLPIAMDGAEGARCQSVRAFGRNLLRLRDLPIAFWDERLSSAGVNRVLIAEGDVSRHRRAELVDKMAAAWILQGALDRLRDV